MKAAERDEKAREEWRRSVQRELDPQRLVFLDEFGSNTAMARRYARAPRGSRAYASIPCNQGRNITVMTSLSLSGIGESMMIQGAVDATVVEVYIERVLGPTLEQGHIVVMDNLPAHKGERVRTLVEARGARVLFVPSYSPDLNPIEGAISKIKGMLRSAGARSQEALQEVLAKALDAITPQDAFGYFSHCGYLPQYQNF